MAFTSSKWTLRDEKCSNGNGGGSGKLEEPKPVGARPMLQCQVTPLITAY